MRADEDPAPCAQVAAVVALASLLQARQLQCLHALLTDSQGGARVRATGVIERVNAADPAMPGLARSSRRWPADIARVVVGQPWAVGQSTQDGENPLYSKCFSGRFAKNFLKAKIGKIVANYSFLRRWNKLLWTSGSISEASC